MLLVDVSRAAALLSFVLGQRLLLTLSFSLAMSPPRFLLASFPNKSLGGRSLEAYIFEPEYGYRWALFLLVFVFFLFVYTSCFASIR